MMRLERLTTAEDVRYRQAMELYGISFPFHEQREEPSQKRILGDEAYHFTLLYEGETFVGAALYWDTETFRYLEHFCVVPEHRGKGYGARALELLTAEEKPTILEIDPPVDEISCRRKGFYLRCGFVENPWPHTHPPYHAYTPGHSLELLSAPRSISEEEYRTFASCLAGHIMKDAF